MGKGKIWAPATPKPLNYSSSKFEGDYVRDTILKILSRSDKGFCFRACTILRTEMFTWVLNPTTANLSQDAITNVDAKYVKRHGFAKGCAQVSGSQNQNLAYTPFFQKPRHFGFALFR